MSHLRHYLETTSVNDQSSAAIAYLAALDHLRNAHPTIADAVIQELQDQRSYLKLIASENYCSLAVQLAMGNLLTDKYSEGYVAHRFYAGCENVDVIEGAAAAELKAIFGCDHAYVQPHSGADANLVAFWSIRHSPGGPARLGRLRGVACPPDWCVSDPTSRGTRPAA